MPYNARQQPAAVPLNRGSEGEKGKKKKKKEKKKKKQANDYNLEMANSHM